jgi:hypothetical protein
MTAVETLLTGLIDYAGLYPPAGLDMPSAVLNYRSYQQGPHAFALGRFIVDIARTEELRQVAGEHLRSMPLSLISPSEIELQSLTALTDAGFRIESIEMKCSEPATIAELGRRLPRNIERYIETPIAESAELLDALAASGMHAKLRMGGVVPEAFPDARSVALFLKELLRRNIAFKATAGLHHPLRARHRVTYALDSSLALMHGFVNLACAAMLLHSGWSVDDAVATLEDQNPDSWDLSADVIRCRSFAWNIAPLRDLRSFFLSFGSCSFTEPIADLEALGWL